MPALCAFIGRFLAGASGAANSFRASERESYSVAGGRAAIVAGTMDFSHPLIDLVQWPAMVTTVVAAWLVASTRKWRRNVGFWCFLASNVMWVAWGLHAGAWALIALQVALAGLNIRGVRKTEVPEGGGATRAR